MTVQEYIDKHQIQSPYSSHKFEFAEVFECWISIDGVVMEQYSEGEYTLHNIKTMEQFSKLCELLTGKPFDYEH